MIETTETDQKKLPEYCRNRRICATPKTLMVFVEEKVKVNKDVYQRDIYI